MLFQTKKLLAQEGFGYGTFDLPSKLTLKDDQSWTRYEMFFGRWFSLSAELVAVLEVVVGARQKSYAAVSWKGSSRLTVAKGLGQCLVALLHAAHSSSCRASVLPISGMGAMETATLCSVATIIWMAFDWSHLTPSWPDLGMDTMSSKHRYSPFILAHTFR